MLGQRIVTAVILLAVLVAVVSAPNPIYFYVFVSLAAATAFWEWLRMTLRESAMKQGLALSSAAILFGLFILASFALSGQLFRALQESASNQKIALFFVFISALAWLIFVPFELMRASVEKTGQFFLHSLFGLITIIATWYAIVVMYSQKGAWFVLSYLALIWCADIFAYFGGRYFGGAKLAPKISPGKTRSGAYCGIVAAIGWMLASASVNNSFANMLVQEGSFWFLPLIGALLAVYSIIGDLYESLIKRRAGFKDSSHLLPGHGGVWDRLDSVLSVSPIAMLLWYLLTH